MTAIVNNNKIIAQLLAKFPIIKEPNGLYSAIDIILSFIGEIDEVEVVKELIKPQLKHIESINKEILLELVEVFNEHHNSKIADFILEAHGPLPKPIVKPQFKFRWLNDKIEADFLNLQQQQKTSIARTMQSVCDNPELLDRNLESVGFVKKDDCDLRDLKKHGTQGCRIYYCIDNQRRNGVLLGVSNSKSTTDAPISEINRFKKLAKATIATDNFNQYAVITIANLMNESSTTTIANYGIGFVNRLIVESVLGVTGVEQVVSKFNEYFKASGLSIHNQSCGNDRSVYCVKNKQHIGESLDIVTEAEFVDKTMSIIRVKFPSFPDPDGRVFFK